jgi:hypothetical protein
LEHVSDVEVNDVLGVLDFGEVDIEVDDPAADEEAVLAHTNWILLSFHCAVLENPYQSTDVIAL